MTDITISEQIVPHNGPKIGWSAPLLQAELVYEAGYDYLEAQVVPMNLENDAAFAEAQLLIDDLPLPARVFSYLFPHDMRVVGPGIDEPRNRAYFDRVVTLLARARADILVVGSGWTRNIPNGWTQSRAEAEFLHAITWCADALRGSGVTLVIEPLNRKESNLINSIADGVRLAKLLNRPDVRVLADFYHMCEEAEPLSALQDHFAWLEHIQFADTDRLNPGTGDCDYASFFGYLKTGGYHGLLSAECFKVKGELLPAMRYSSEFLRRAWAEAQAL